LTGVRAIAAFMVFLHHYNPFPANKYGTYLYNFTQELHIGVTLFFVLSGFLIAYRYSDLTNFSFRNYMVNRIARIYPMYFLLTTLAFIGLIRFGHQSITGVFPTYLLNVSFLRGFFDQFKFTGIAQGWSLTVEETFYLFAPVFFFLIRRNRYYLITLPVLLVTFGVGLVFLFNGRNTYGFFNSYDFLFNYTFFGRCFEFFIGIGLAIVYKQNVLKPKFKYFTYLGILGIISCVFLISLLKGNADFGIRHPLGKLINTFLLPAIGISVFYFGLLTERTLVSSLLGSKLFVILGKSSYIFYLIHVGIFATILHKFTSNLLLIFLAINLISIILYTFIEHPLNDYIRKRFVRRIGQPAYVLN